MAVNPELCLARVKAPKGLGNTSKIDAVLDAVWQNASFSDALKRDKPRLERGLIERPRSDSNRRIADLQSAS